MAQIAEVGAGASAWQLADRYVLRAVRWEDAFSSTLCRSFASRGLRRRGLRAGPGERSAQALPEARSLTRGWRVRVRAAGRCWARGGSWFRRGEPYGRRFGRTAPGRGRRGLLG